MKKQLLPLFVLLLIALNTQAQVILRNNDSNGYFPKIVINNTRTDLYTKKGGNTILWLNWEKVPKLYENCSSYGRCFEMKVYSSDNVADRTFYFKYHVDFREQRNLHPTPYGFMKATYVYKDGRPTKSILENFTGDKI